MEPVSQAAIVERLKSRVEARQPRGWPYRPLLWVLAAACAGTALDRLLEPALLVWWCVVGAAAAIWAALWRGGRFTPAAVALLVSVAGAGGVWHHLWWNAFSVDELGRLASREGSGVVAEVLAVSSVRHLPAPPFDPLRSYTVGPRSRLRVRALRLRDGGGWRNVTGRAELEVDGQLLGVLPGDRLRVCARLAAPLPRLNPGGWDTAARLRGDRVLCRLRSEFPDCVTLLERGAWWRPARLLALVRRSGDRRLWASLDRRHSRLAAALLLGLRDELDLDQSDRFFRTGTVHLLAVSGMHLGILVGALWLTIRAGLLPERLGQWLMIGAALGYALLTQAEPPVVRAALMVLVVGLAALGRRPADGLQALSLAGLVVLGLNPCDLFRVGTQLSFLCVVVLMLAAQLAPRARPLPPLEQLLASTRPLAWRMGRGLLRIMAWSWYLTSAVWLVTLPLVASQFHLVAPIALLLNLVLLPLVTLAMAAGAALLLVGWLVPPLGSLAARCCDASLAALDKLVELAGRVPGGALWVAGPSAAWVVLGYIVLALAVWCIFRPRWRWWFGAAWLGWWVAWGAGLTSGRAGGDFRATCLAVGHGCAVVLELPDGKTVLYDAGQLGSPEACAQAITRYLWSEGKRRIDSVVISHEDVDHFNALPELLERVTVGQVVVAAPMQFEGGAARVVAEAIDRFEIPLQRLARGDRLAIDPLVGLEVLHPPAAGVAEGSDNAQSLVLAVTVGQFRLLLCGDLEPPGTEQLLSTPPRGCDVLLAPHHGSPRSNPPGLFDWCRPEQVVISGGFSAGLAEVRGDYQFRGARVWHTAADGAVQFEVVDGAVVTRQFRSGGWIRVP